MELRYLVAALLLLVPSTLMGLTYPLVVQAADPEARGGGAGLYACNTAGATLGCLLAGFFGIGVLGISTTAQLAALGNVLCGLAVLALFHAGRSASPAVTPAASPAENSSDDPAPARAAVLAAAALAGASALAAEILWTRSLLPYVNSSSYAFSAILSTYLAGLALGSGWVAARASHLTPPRLAVRFGLLQLTLMVLLAATPHLLRMAEALVPGYVGIRQITSLGQLLRMMAGVFAKTGLVVLAPTLMMGASLPLCIALAVRGGLPGGKAAGLVSAVNTLGGIAGSALAGFVLLPLLGSRWALLVAGLGNLGAALLILPSAKARLRPPAVRGALVTGALLLVFLARPTVTTPFLGRLAAGSDTLLVDEGPQDTTAVIEQGPPGHRERLILSNGVSYAGDAPPAQRYMGLLGQLPVLLADDAGQALVICVGTGTTAANVAVFAEVRRLDLVDISPAVHKTLPLFVQVNRAVWTDPRVELHAADGRQFMTRAPQGYGVITLEPPPPRAAGAASLYTIELYQRARASLRQGGAIAQWLPLHGMTEAEILMLARTFMAVFPESALFLLNPYEAALLSSPSALPVDLDRLRRQLDPIAVRAALGRIGFDTRDTDRLAAQVLALAASHGDRLRRLVGDGPVVTDNRPLIEQFGVLLANSAAGRLDSDGRRGLLRRLVADHGPPLPGRGAPLPDLPAASEAVHAQVRAWLAAVER
jgi:predicted membrane-bound spermidine synthase